MKATIQPATTTQKAWYLLKTMGYNDRHQKQTNSAVLSLIVISGAACSCYYYREITAAAKCIVDDFARRLDTCKQQLRYDNESPPTAYETLIGNTPLIKLQHLSLLLRRSVYVKMESMNPGGTGKDRAALSIIQHAEENGRR